MVRKLTPFALVSLFVLAACGTQGAARLEDPEEILTQSIESMADVDTVHFVLGLDGDVSVPEMGGEMSLDGTQVEGSLSMDGSAAQLQFAVPALLGISGEVRLLGDEAFVRTSMTGPLWMRQPVTEGSDDPLAQAGDPQEAIAELQEFLAKDGVTLEKLDDVECGDSTCYQLQLTIAPELLAEQAGEEGAEVLGPVAEEGLTLDLQIDVDSHHLVGVSTSFADEEMGNLDLTLTFDGFGDPVEVEAPPSDEITDEPGGFTLP